jgi:isopentenyl diphosphate isomerase/L-lactate dehydrogenase-like FMN-dependent dehydrogenase
VRSESALARQVRSPRVVNIADLRERARRRLPALVFDYIDGAAEDSVTLERNRAAFSDVMFRPRQCVPVPACDLRTTVLGTELALPFLLAPVGNIRSFYPMADVHAARAAHAAGTAFIQSTFSGVRIEDVRASTAGPLWYQLYVPGGRDVAEATIARARAAGYKALMVTIDTPVAGLRERDVRNGAKQVLSGSLLTSLPFLWQFVKRPRWVMDFMADGAPRVFPNVELPGVGPMPAGDVGTLLEQTLVTWKDLRWMRDAWQGPIVVKGVHTADDARCAMDEGADAVVVSNHGGRQLDGVPGSLQALPEVIEAVNGRIEVLMDGGIRRGADVAKALSIGARAVLIGRAYAWALGAAGGPGVARAIEILKTDLVRTMRLLGCDAVRNLDSSYVDMPVSWHPRPRG